MNQDLTTKLNPKMVKGLQMMLNVAGIDDDDIRTDEFGGY
jgi:hypothetical protein